jgi:hypothetical protein
MTEIEIIKVGNPNRLVKVAIKEYLKTALHTYIYNDKTGEIAFLTKDLKDPENWFLLDDYFYPIYKDGKYIGDSYSFYGYRSCNER